MVDYGVTNEGFVLKRLSNILSDIKSKLSTITDPNSGATLTPELLDENDPLIQLVNAFSDELSVCWEMTQLAYNQFDPLKASGAGLSGTVQLNNIRRQGGSYSQVYVTCTGTPGLFIPAGSKISNMDDYPIFEIAGVTLDEAGEGVTLATCTEQGPFGALAGTLVKINTPISGWTAVTNTIDATAGSYEESDVELRIRQQASTSQTAQTIIEAIAAGINNLDGVTFCKAYQNVTLSTDSRGIPAKSVAVIVQGGTDTEIAQELFYKLAAGGADCIGDEEIVVYDNQGVGYPMRFSRPTEVNITVEVSFTIINASLFPSDGETQIKTAIISWAQLGATSLNIANYYDQNGYSPGQSVYASELYVPVFTIPGIKVNGIILGNDAPPALTEIEIEWNEVAAFDADNITVTEV